MRELSSSVYYFLPFHYYYSYDSGERLSSGHPEREYTGEWAGQIARRGHIILHDMVNKSYRAKMKIKGLDQPRDWVPKSR